MPQFELHFQEGFTGQRVEVLAGGEVIAALELRTRFQTGLAHIQEMTLQEGEEVTLRIGETGSQHVLYLDPDRPFVTVTMEGGALRVVQTAIRPGYL